MLGHIHRRSGLLWLGAICCLTALWWGSGCVSGGSGTWPGLVSRAQHQGFQPVNLQGDLFGFSGLLKVPESSSSQELMVYLEGDGRAFIGGRPSLDPSPRIPLACQLAQNDPAPAVLYLARLGQYRQDYAGPDYQSYWTEKRLAPEIVADTNLALDRLKSQLGVRWIHLIGYSGGGGLATLLAARRTDVVSLTTVAGLLDHEWWTKTENYQPLAGSLNPADYVNRLTSLPQVHFYGTKDSVIPPAMSAHYQGLTDFVSSRRVPVATDHWRNWEELWPELLKEYILPMRAQAVRSSL